MGLDILLKHQKIPNERGKLLPPFHLLLFCFKLTPNQLITTIGVVCLPPWAVERTAAAVPTTLLPLQGVAASFGRLSVSVPLWVANYAQLWKKTKLKYRKYTKIEYTELNTLN